MKKIISLALSALMCILLCSCKNNGTQIVDLYFKQKSENKLSNEKCETPASSDIEKTVKTVIEKLLEGPSNQDYERVLPKGTKLLSVSVKNRVSTIDFSKEFQKNKGAMALLARFSIVNTLCKLQGIDGIVIKVEGKHIVSESDGKEIGVLSLENVAMDISDKVAAKKASFTLYYPKKGDLVLAKEKRSVEIQNTLSLEKTVVSELMKGPKSSKMAAIIPTDAKLLGIETKDGVCFVNFSSEFVSHTSVGSAQTSLLIYSVVNTLCELDGVKSVQILINGETGIEMGNFVFDIPLEADYSI